MIPWVVPCALVPNGHVAVVQVVGGYGCCPYNCVCWKALVLCYVRSVKGRVSTSQAFSRVELLLCMVSPLKAACNDVLSWNTAWELLAGILRCAMCRPKCRGH